MTTNDSVIRLEGLWKRYGLRLPDVIHNVMRWLGAVNKANSSSDMDSDSDSDGPWALRDIDLEVRRGEILGIIGDNGAGKSTLLKVLAGVTPATHGRVWVSGRMFPMIELNAGLHMELTGRENAYLLGAIMGLSRGQIETKMSVIEQFCELGGWLDRPVRMYSRGMLARLGFGVAMNVDADTLLIDEVLAVGDLAFQRKCYRQMEELRRTGVTMILVSHSIRQVERLCSKVILLDQGQIVRCGDPAEVCESYMRTVMETPSKKAGLPVKEVGTEAAWQGSGEVIITEVQTLNSEGEICEDLLTWESVTFRVKFKAQTVIKDPIIGVAIYTPELLLLAACSDENASIGTTIKGEGYFECKIPEIPMLPGVYSVGVTIKGRDNSLIYKGLHLTRFNIQHSVRAKQSRGFVHLEPRWCFTNKNN